MVTKKIGPGWDQRRDADEPSEGNEGFRVDRVFDAPPARPTRPTPPQPAPRRAKSVTLPPRPAGEAVDTELALRRQLSRLQRQLADAQRELANKDDELATEAENRLAMSTEHEKAVAESRSKDTQLDELLGYSARTQGVEKRLQETTEVADALSRERDQEQEHRVAAQARTTEVENAFSDAQLRWAAERSALETAYGNEVGQLEMEKKQSGEAAEAALAATTGRLQKAQEEQLSQLRESHEKSLALLRGELEPKALEARTLAEERSRLTDEITALKAESIRGLAERDETHARELAQQVEANVGGQAAAARAHATEVARLTAERDGLNAAVEQAKQSAIDREKLVDQTVMALREAQKQLQREVAEAKEAVARLEADHGTIAERLETASISNQGLLDEHRQLRGLVESSQREARQNALDRQRFVAYLEEGLALIGALPPDAAPETTSDTGSGAIPAGSEAFSVSFTPPSDKP